MKLILTAAALALTAGMADAAAYRFDFQKTGGSSTFGPGWEIDGGFFILDLPNLISQSISLHIRNGEQFPYPLLAPEFGHESISYGDFDFQTDEVGNITMFYLTLDDAGSTNYYSWTEIGVYNNWDNDEYTVATGYWTITELVPSSVPLPASAVLLLSGILGTAALKRASRK